jgi:hypothetical protein
MTKTAPHNRYFTSIIVKYLLSKSTKKCKKTSFHRRTNFVAATGEGKSGFRCHAFPHKISTTFPDVPGKQYVSIVHKVTRLCKSLIKNPGYSSIQAK